MCQLCFKIAKLLMMILENYKFVYPVWIIPTHRKFCSKDFQRTLTSSKTEMKIGIIGAGAAGLAALRHSLNEQHECEVFEQTGQVGGTWNYTDRVGLDEFGLPIRSSMYQGLRTNLPKELMQFEDYPFNRPEHSYISQPEVLQYIHDYAKHFNLLQHIKFFRHVIQVSPLERGRWSVEVQCLKTKSVETKEFDAIIVCVGNYSVPFMPTLEGLEHFQGTVIHSHNFRKPTPYKNRKVLVIGGGPSGIDITRIVSGVTDNVILSHRSPLNPIVKLPEWIKQKPAINEFHHHAVIFKDGSEESVDDIILCTGYLYSYPFLSKKCDIQVDDKWVKYLYKQIINIKHPTMAFIGIPFRIFPFVIFGIQVRFFLAYLKGTFSITKDKMSEELEHYMNKRKAIGLPDSQAHFLGTEQGDYMEDLALTANIKKVPPVFTKLYKYVHGEGKGKIHLSYRIITDEDFIILEDCPKP